MIREHPRFQKTAIIFISAVHADRHRPAARLRDGRGRLRSGAGRPGSAARQGQGLRRALPQDPAARAAQRELERRVAERTAELEASTDAAAARASSGAASRSPPARWARGTGTSSTGECVWDDGPVPDFRRRPGNFASTPRTSRALIHPEDWRRICRRSCRASPKTRAVPDRIPRHARRTARCAGASAPRRRRVDGAGNVVRVSGVTVDITERKEAEERQMLLAREVDHRASNALAVVQSIVRLTRASTASRLHRRRRGPHQGAVARAHAACRSRAGRAPTSRPGRGGAGALSRRRRRARSSSTARR